MYLVGVCFVWAPSEAQTSQTANTRVIMTVRIIRHGQSLFLSPTHNAVRCVTLHCREREREPCCVLPAACFAIRTKLSGRQTTAIPRH